MNIHGGDTEGYVPEAEDQRTGVARLRDTAEFYVLKIQRGWKCLSDSVSPLEYG